MMEIFATFNKQAQVYQSNAVSFSSFEAVYHDSTKVMK